MLPAIIPAMLSQGSSSVFNRACSLVQRSSLVPFSLQVDSFVTVHVPSSCPRAGISSSEITAPQTPQVTFLWPAVVQVASVPSVFC